MLNASAVPIRRFVTARKRKYCMLTACAHCLGHSCPVASQHLWATRTATGCPGRRCGSCQSARVPSLNCPLASGDSCWRAMRRATAGAARAASPLTPSTSSLSRGDCLIPNTPSCAPASPPLEHRAVLRGLAHDLISPGARTAWLGSDDALATRHAGAVLSNVERLLKESPGSGSSAGGSGAPERGVPLPAFVARLHQRNETLQAVASLPTSMRSDILLPALLRCSGALSRLTEATLSWSAGGTKTAIRRVRHDHLVCVVDGDRRLALWSAAFKRQIESSTSAGWSRRSGGKGGAAGAVSRVDVDGIDLRRYPARHRMCGGTIERRPFNQSCRGCIPMARVWGGWAGGWAAAPLWACAPDTTDATGGGCMWEQ